MKLFHQGPRQKYCSTREHICMIPQDIFPSPSSHRASRPTSSSTTSQDSCDRETESVCSIYSTWTTRQLCQRLAITYNEMAYMKLHSRLQIWTLNNVLLQTHWQWPGEVTNGWWLWCKCSRVTNSPWDWQDSGEVINSWWPQWWYSRGSIIQSP